MKRKRLFCVLSLLSLLIILGACGGSERELDFQSIHDLYADVIISLGDSEAYVEERLGSPIGTQPFLFEGSFTHVYENGLTVNFTNGIVVSFHAENEAGAGRFEILLFNRSMMLNEIRDTFMPEAEGEWSELRQQLERQLGRTVQRFQMRYCETGRRLGEHDIWHVRSTVEWVEYAGREYIRLGVAIAGLGL